MTPKLKQVGVKEKYPLKVVTLLLLQIDKDMLLILASNSDKLFNSVNIDDLEWSWTPKIEGFSTYFLQFLAATHISRVNCAIITWDRPKQPSDKILTQNVHF